MSLAPLADAHGRDPLDDCIEAHMHGAVRFATDVEAVVLDPCFRAPRSRRSRASCRAPSNGMRASGCRWTSCAATRLFFLTAAGNVRAGSLRPLDLAQVRRRRARLIGRTEALDDDALLLERQGLLSPPLAVACHVPGLWH